MKLLDFRSKMDHSLTVWLFLRCLGFIYFFAFLSLSVQIIGLFGQEGILPAKSFLHMVDMNLGNQRFLTLPTIFWLDVSNNMLLAVCILGCIFSLLVIFDKIHLISFLILWFLYLSLVNIGQDFLSFQWDALLLEAGFLAIFLAIKAQPSLIFVWLSRWLLFRLMFESGLVKLASGDITWHNLTALDFHYFTQPLPTPMAWYAAELPHWFNAMSVLFVFAIELILPFLIFAGRKMRILAAFLFILLQLGIAITGNYAYFNLLAITLCICLLDDKFIKSILNRVLVSKSRIQIALATRLNQLSAYNQLSGLTRIIVMISGIFIMLISIGSLERGLVGLIPVPSAVVTLHDLSQPFYISNNYGLFAVMTTTRPEIIVEGSNDGNLWQAYEFKYKPGVLDKAPPIVAPHQPRLDWQMWFAALSGARGDRWFINFLFRLLQGKKDVLNLLAKNPFPDKPPKYIRANLYDYRFTNASERNASNNWWKRELTDHCIEPICLPH